MNLTRRHIVSDISKALHEVAPDCTAILYGSEARNEARSDSDIDVLILLPVSQKSYAIRKIEITERLYEIELACGVTISPLIVKKAWWERMNTPFTCNVAKDGIAI